MPEKLATNRGAYPFQSSLDRSVVYCATHAHGSAAQNGWILRISRADLLAGKLCCLPFECATFCCAQHSRGRHFGIYESQSRPQVFFKLRDDRRKKWHPAVVNQHRHEISRCNRITFAFRESVQHSAFLSRWNGWGLPRLAKVAAFRQQS